MSIHLVIGPMFAGKSSELIRKLRRYRAANKSVAVLKPVLDTRCSTDIVETHDNTTIPARSVSSLCDYVPDADVIGVDEGQFFPDLARTCELWASQGKIVIVAALDGTYQRKPFLVVSELIPLCEEVVRLTAVCHSCGEDAAFSRRLGDSDDPILIGGADLYVASCRKCLK